LPDSEIFRATAQSVAQSVEAGQTVGLGTGRAASTFVRALGQRVAGGLSIRGVPTSRATARLAESLGIPLTGMDQVQEIALAVDGADEVDDRRNLIKGHGGALVRERVVAAAARRFLILVGPEKLSSRLGERMSVPVEVIPFAAGPARRALEALGASAALRKDDSGVVFVTDNGNWIVTAAFGPIPDPGSLHREILGIPGVVDSGLFVGMADEVRVATTPSDPARDEVGASRPDRARQAR